MKSIQQNQFFQRISKHTLSQNQATSDIIRLNSNQPKLDRDKIY